MHIMIIDWRIIWIDQEFENYILYYLVYIWKIYILFQEYNTPTYLLSH